MLYTCVSAEYKRPRIYHIGFAQTKHHFAAEWNRNWFQSAHGFPNITNKSHVSEVLSTTYGMPNFGNLTTRLWFEKYLLPTTNAQVMAKGSKDAAMFHAGDSRGERSDTSYYNLYSSHGEFKSRMADAWWPSSVLLSNPRFTLNVRFEAIAPQTCCLKMIIPAMAERNKCGRRDVLATMWAYKCG